MTILSNKQVSEKARELIECLGMWDITKEDALRIAYSMVTQARNLKSMPNPLANTGMKAITSANDEQNAISRQRIFHEPIERTN